MEETKEAHSVDSHVKKKNVHIVKKQKSEGTRKD